MTRDDLPGLVRQAAEGAWLWGTADCTWWFTAWLEAVRGCPVPCRRPVSALDAARMVRRAGGMVALYDQVLGAMGIGQTARLPEDGDVAVVRVVDIAGRRARTLDLGALRVGGAWVVRTGRGVAAGQFEALAVWRVV